MPPDHDRLIRIENTLDLLKERLIGPDGDGGVIAEHDNDLIELKQDRDAARGAMWMVRAILAVFGVTEIARWYRGH